MDLATQQQLIKRILAHIAAKTSDCGAVETLVPTDSYLDEDLFRRELATVRRWPHLLAHASQLAEPGDFLADEVYGVPVVVVRAADGRLHGHINVCRHRGARLVEADGGTKLDAFACPYHAWRYELDGALSHVPDRERCFSDVTTGDRNLRPVTVWESHGFVWLCLPGEPALDSDEFLAGVGTDLATYEFGNDVVYGTERLTGTFNWKLGVEAFLEVYHFRTLHPDMKNYVFSPEVALFDQLGNHHLRLVAPKREIKDLAQIPERDWALRSRATVVYHLFPGTFLFVEKKHASSLQIRPVSPSRSEVRIIHFARPEGLRRPGTLEQNVALFMKAVGEDLGACESIQKGLGALSQDLLIGRSEVGLQIFRETLESALDPVTVG